MSKRNIFQYCINLDERGEFYADVRNANDKTVFEINTEDMQQLCEDGFMKHTKDIQGLQSYLKSMRIIPDQAVLVPMQF